MGVTYYVYAGETSTCVLDNLDNMFVFQDGTAYRTVANSGGFLYVSRGGLASRSTINSGGRMYVSNSGLASQTTINSNGRISIFSGGTAGNTVVNSKGELCISSGGVADYTSLTYDSAGGGYVEVVAGGNANHTFVSGGGFNIYAGGSASATTVTRTGYFNVWEAGSAANTTISSGGEMMVSTGGYACKTTVAASGHLHVKSGALVSSTTITSATASRGVVLVSNGGTACQNIVNGGLLLISAGGSAVNTTVTGSGEMDLVGNVGAVSYGRASNTTVKSGGKLNVNSGAIIHSTTLAATGTAFVGSGGVANYTAVSGGELSATGFVSNTTILRGGRAGIFAEGTADGTTINNEGIFYLASGWDSLPGGKATNTTVNGGGQMLIYSAAVANDTTITASGGYWGDVRVYKGGLASNTTVNGGILNVAEGGSANSATINNEGECIVWASANVDYIGGKISNVTVNGGGLLLVQAGATADHTVLASTGYSGGKMYVSGGTASNTIISGGILTLSSGGLLDVTTIRGNHGTASVSSGGTANNTAISSDGCMKVNVGGTANDTTINDSGTLYIFSGGVGNRATANSNGLLRLRNGVVNSAVINSGGKIFLDSCSVANSTTIKAGGSMGFDTGSIANDTIVSSGGSMTISSGGQVSGTLNLIKGAIVSACEGAKIDFTVSEQTDAAAALITNWNLIAGSSNASCTVTVNADQKKGTYVLADNAAGFDKTITVRTVDDTTLGTISAGETKTLGGKGYTLANDADELTLTVGAEVIKQTISDYNKSGKSDMIQFVDGLVYVTHDTESGYVQTGPVNDITGWNVVEIRRDLTGDGYADIQITSDDGYGSTWVATLRNDYSKAGCITLKYQFIGAYNNELWSYLGSADFNGDGKSEILMVQTEAGKDEYGHRNVAGWVTDDTTCEWIDNIWLGALNDGWNIAGTADVTGDGKDNVILRSADGMIGYWAKFGGMPEDIVELKNAGDRIMLTTGDFDGDGAQDFLWKSLSGDEMSVWSDLDLGSKFTDKAIGNISDLGGSWTFAGTGDYNGDGKDEILWCDTTTYKTAYSEGNKENFTKLTVIA